MSDQVQAPKKKVLKKVVKKVVKKAPVDGAAPKPAVKAPAKPAADKPKKEVKKPKPKTFTSKAKLAATDLAALRKETLALESVLSGPRLTAIMKDAVVDLVEGLEPRLRGNYIVQKEFESKVTGKRTLRTVCKIGKTANARRLLARMVEREGIEAAGLTALMVPPGMISITNANLQLAIQRRGAKFPLHDPSVPPSLFECLKIN